MNINDTRYQMLVSNLTLAHESNYVNFFNEILHSCVNQNVAVESANVYQGGREPEFEIP